VQQYFIGRPAGIRGVRPVLRLLESARSISRNATGIGPSHRLPESRTALELHRCKARPQATVPTALIP
jgi:hypothetical protein